jgi:23S rRNA (adenine2503-C2)-methyltransferase
LNRKDIKSFTLEQLNAELEKLSQPKFRAKQIFDWLHQKRVNSFDEMTNLPGALRTRLKENYTITQLTVQRKLVSQLDGTVKYLYRLPDGECVESVLMKYKHGNSICVSSQVGCKMGCAFCASTKAGFIRSLTSSEILEQIYQTEKDLGIRISHVVLMGIGEPLDNFENVVTFLELINSPFGANISLRNISVSTCGLVDKIYQLAELKLGITLSISLHACDNETRDRIMPVNHKWKIEELLKACQYYTQVTNRRISFEYALIQGENDSPAQAAKLADLLRGQLCHVNLIPVNEVKETSFKKTARQNVLRFQEELIRRGINATVRRTLGADISAACGQLRRDHIEE